MVRKLKHTEIGDIPVDWELQTFDETFRVISNNTLSRENLNNRGGAVRNIHYGDILTKFPEVLDCSEDEIPFVNDLSLLSSSTQLLQDGDIVVADTAEDETVGKVIEVQNLGDSKLVAGLHTIPCRVKKGDFAPGWLGYYMNSDLFHNQILPYITGIKVSSISKGAISETLILVPPFDEQEKIVQSLNKIQLLMTAETKVVNKIKLVKNGCLSKMFPQKDDTVPEIRLPGFTEAWEQRKLGELGSLKNGMNFSKEAMGHGFPFINLQNIFGNNVIDVNKLELADATEKQLLEYSLLKGDVLFVRSSVKLEGVGEAALVPETLENTTYSGFIIRFRDEYGLNNDFKKYIFGTQKVRNQIMAQATNSANKNISQGVLENLTFEVPSFDEQAKIGEHFSNLDHLITLHQCKCDKYSNIKKGMMSDLLTGKIRLV